MGLLRQRLFQIRRRKGLDYAALTAYGAPLDDQLHVEALKAVDDRQIRQETGSNGTPVPETEILGRIPGGSLDGGDGFHATGHGGSDDIVDMALFQQVDGMLVVGAEDASIRVALFQQGRQRLQIPGGGTVADHNVLAAPEFFQCFLHLGTFVIGADARCSIGSQLLAVYAGSVAVDERAVALGTCQFFKNLRVLVDHAEGVHHLRQSQHTGMGVEAVDGAVVQLRTGLIQWRGGNAAWQHKEYVHRQIFRGLEHIFDAVGTHDVGDLVGVCDHGGRPVGHDGLGKFAGADQRGLQMDMGVDKARADDLARNVDFRFALIASHAGNTAFGDRNISPAKLVGKHVDVDGVFQNQIGFFPSHGHVDEGLLFRHCLLQPGSFAVFRHITLSFLRDFGIMLS